MKTWRYNGCERHIGDIHIDNRWERIFDRTEAQIVADNKKLAEAIKGLPGYTISDTPYSLNVLEYVDWTLECQDSSIAKMNKIAEDNNPINTLANVQLFYLIISFLSLLIIGIISPGFVVYKQVLNLLGREEADKDIIASNGMRLIAVIFIVLKGAFLISALVITKNFTHIVDYVNEKKCSDATTIEIFLFLRSVLQDAYDQNLIGLIAVAIMAAFELAAAIILCSLSCAVWRRNRDKNKKMYVKK